MKWYLNGFPKSGLHLLEALLKPITQDGGVLGTYNYGSWRFDRAPLSPLMHRLSYMPDGYRLIGHAYYDKTLDNFLYDAGIAHVFIYRNLRDVAVSQAYHILSDNPVLLHPDKELYKAMGSFEEVLAAVWYGINGYPSVIERWRQYEGWLDSSHTMTIDFNDLVGEDGLIDNVWRILSKGAYHERGYFEAHKIQIMDMVASARDTAASPTFRRGIPGEWKQYAEVFERETA